MAEQTTSEPARKMAWSAAGEARWLVYGKARDPDVPDHSYGFIWCPNCGSSARADLVQITVERYGLTTQAARFQCPVCRWLMEDPPVLVLHEKAVEAFFMAAPKLSELTTSGDRCVVRGCEREATEGLAWTGEGPGRRRRCHVTCAEHRGSLTDLPGQEAAL